MRTKKGRPQGCGGEIVVLSKYRHGRASSSEGPAAAARRAAKLASISTVTPAACPMDDDAIGTHQSAGMLSRCGHLRADQTGAPISAAMSAGVRQSATTSRKDETVVMLDSTLGHCVLKDKAILSYDCGRPVGETRDMADRKSETEEKAAFIARTKRAREARFPTQRPILTILEIDQGTYKQYEARTPLPHRYIPKFCAATGVDVEWLLTGQGKGPQAIAMPPQEAKEPPRRRGRKPRPRAA